MVKFSGVACGFCMPLTRGHARERTFFQFNILSIDKTMRIAFFTMIEILSKGLTPPMPLWLNSKVSAG